MKKIEHMAVDNLRIVSAQMIRKARSGHTGMCLGAAPLMFTLFSKLMRYNPKNPNYFNRDRLILSAGHSSALYYACLNMFGYKITKSDLKNFRQLNSRAPGHPEYGVTPGVETSTGPLGQGVANAVGMALGYKRLAERINKPKFDLINNYIYCLVGEGCLMEGVSNEAMSLAGTWNLSNLVLLYDANEVTIDGNSNLAFTEDLEQKVISLGWDYFEVAEAENIDLIEKTIKRALATSTKPKFIKVKSVLGSKSELEGSEKIHGVPLTDAQFEDLEQQLDCYLEPFTFDKSVSVLTDLATDQGQRLEWAWNVKVAEYGLNYVSDYEYLKRVIKPDLKFKKPIDSLYKLKYKVNMQTRDYAHIVLNHLAQRGVPYLGGAADVATSTRAFLDETPENNLHFGVREHAMGGICNGLALVGNNRVFCSTFLPFIDYMKNSVRMAALMNLPILYICSHDSFYVGEDGPSHQCVEQLVELRATPNLTVFRPYNMNEVIAGFITSLKQENPVVIACNKNKDIKENSSIEECLKGAYQIGDKYDEFDLIIIATGSEVCKALEIQRKYKLKQIRVRVVSMPSIEIFEKQSEQYKNSLLPKNFEKIVCIEAGSSYSWYRYVGKKGLIISQDKFGKSGCVTDLEIEFGFDTNIIFKKIENYLKNFE